LPVLAEAFDVLGVELAARKDFRSSIASLQRARDLEPDNVQVLNNLAVVFSESGDEVSAQKWFAQAVAHKKAKPDYFICLARSYVKSGDLESAKKALLAGVTRFPKSSEMLAHTGGVLLLMGESENAVSLLARGGEVEPTNSAILFDYAGALEAVGEPFIALETYRRIDPKSPNYKEAVKAIKRLQSPTSASQ